MRHCYTGSCKVCGKKFFSRDADSFIATTLLLEKLDRHKLAALKWELRAILKRL